MVIRRIREHVAAHNWFAVGIDFLIVVVGIVIGTQVNNWNQTRLDRNQGKEYRERLITELHSNDAHNQDRRAYWQQVRRHAQAALDELENPSGDGPALVVDAYQASQIVSGQSRRFVYDELISTGRIEHIGSAKLRNEVSGYYVGVQAYGVFLDAVPPYREYLRHKMPSAAQQAVRTQCPEVYYPGPDGTPYVRLPDRCSLKLDPVLTARAVAIVRNDSNMVEHLNRVIADLDIKLALLDAMDNHSHRVRSEIAKARSG